jgi:hypothetical protein
MSQRQLGIYVMSEAYPGVVSLLLRLLPLPPPSSLLLSALWLLPP